MTEKFAEMKTFEPAILGQLTESAVAHEAKTLAEMRVVLALELAALAIVLTLSMLVVHDLTSGIRGLKLSVQRL